MRRAPLALLTLLALSAIMVPALAATPESGEVSKASVQVKWSGETNNGFVTTITAITAGRTVVCEPPTCDTFALKVRDSDLLTVTASSATPFTMVEVVTPNGETIYNSGDEDNNSTQVQIENAPVGDYEVHVALNSPQSASYTGMAVLGPVDAKGRPGGQPPAQGPPPSSGPEPQPTQPGAHMSVKTKKASARKVRKKLKVAVATSAPVTDVKATLMKGSKTLGTGTAARVEKTATIAVKLRRRLKRGSYRVSVVGRDSGGRTVGASAPLKVGR